MTSRHQPQTSTSTVSVGESADGEIMDDLVRLMKRRRTLINTDVTGIHLCPKKQTVRIKSKQQSDILSDGKCQQTSKQINANTNINAQCERTLVHSSIFTTTNFKHHHWSVFHAFMTILFKATVY